MTWTENPGLELVHELERDLLTLFNLGFAGKAFVFLLLILLFGIPFLLALRGRILAKWLSNKINGGDNL